MTQKDSNMRVLVTGGTGHSGPYIISDLIAAGHAGIALARSDKSAAAVSGLGAKVRRGDISDLDGTEEDPALPPGGDEYKGSLRVRNVVEFAVIGLAERGVRSSAVRIPPIMHSST